MDVHQANKRDLDSPQGNEQMAHTGATSRFQGAGHSFGPVSNYSILERQVRRESSARTYPRHLPLVLSEAKGVYVRDANGLVYYDCLAGAGTLALGHNHPVVTEAIQALLKDHRPLHTLDLSTPLKDEFVSELFESLPEEFASRARIQFCSPSGADAVEAAVKLVKTATNRRSMFAFHGGYHGMSHGALSLTGNVAPKTAVGGLMTDVHFLPYPYSYRCPFGLGGEVGQETSSRYIERLIRDPESGIVPPAAMIVELVQGEGGVIPAPDAWVRELRRITLEHHIPLIVDEVQSGLGRTGRLYAFQHAGIVPDVLLLSKAVGGGLPLAVVVYDSSLDRWLPGAHAGTFRGNQMAMAAGLATLRHIRENELPTHAEAMGQRLMSHLREIQRLTCSIGEVRGRGLMIGVEIVNTEKAPDGLGSYPAHPTLARLIQAQCLHRGLIVEIGGRHGSVVRFLPPLIVTPKDIDSIAGIFECAINAAENLQEARVTAGACA
jgi:diaminobutyrate-2-oxoglutarate transaminase